MLVTVAKPPQERLEVDGAKSVGECRRPDLDVAIARPLRADTHSEHRPVVSLDPHIRSHSVQLGRPDPIYAIAREAECPREHVAQVAALGVLVYRGNVEEMLEAVGKHLKRLALVT